MRGGGGGLGEVGLWALALGLILGGCGPRTPEAASPGAASTPKTSTTAVAPPSAAPDAPEVAPSASAPARPLVPHAYQEVASGYGGLSLYGGVPRWFADGRAIDLRSGQVEFSTYFANSITLEGDSLWYAHQFSPMSACPMPSTFLRLEGRTWRPRLEGNVHDLWVRPWVRGSSIAAIVPLRAGPPWGYELVVLEKNRTPPKPARRARNQAKECHTRLDTMEGFLAFSSGEILVLGRECELLAPEVEEEVEIPPGGCVCVGLHCPPECPARPEPPEPEEALLIEFFGKGRHEFLAYPFVEPGALRGNAPTSVWTSGTDAEGKWAFAHFDGATWTVLPERFAEEIPWFVVPPGELGVGARRLFRLEGRLLELRGAELEGHELPAGCSSFDFELDGEHLWVTCEKEAELVLYTTRTDIPRWKEPDATGAESADALQEPAEFSPKGLPRLDPTAPSLQSCGGRERREEFDYRTAPSPGSKVSPGSKPPAPRPMPSPGSKIVRPTSDFYGY